MKQPNNQTFLRILLVLILVMSTMGFYGCSSSNKTDNPGTDTPAGVDRGQLNVSLTDAQGDFVSYTVDVQSLTLTKADGTIVNALPLSTRVDFAQYVDMTEFLTSAMVPVGRYISATMVLDYQNAEIYVENAQGAAVKVTNIVDENNAALTTLTVSVHLEDRKALMIAPGLPSHLTLDFDLKASNTVTFSDSGVPTLIVEPILLADVDPKESKIHRVRGPLKDVDIEDSSFRVIIHPFHHLFSEKHERFGVLKVSTSDQTVYSIDGQEFQGADGLTALSELPALTGVVAVGTLQCKPYRFEAQEVYAGSSVPGGRLDVVTGNVIRRTGDEIVIKGATLERSDSKVMFNDQVTVLLGDDTQVTRAFSTATFNIDDISVGQRIRVFGTLTNTDKDALEMDAREGMAQLLLTRLRGTVLSTGAETGATQLTMDLKAIDGRNVDIFNFQGTGTDSTHDADPSLYEIQAAGLKAGSLVVEKPVEVRGFVSAFGQAPPDFRALSLIQAGPVKAFLKVKWHPPTSNAFTSLTAQGLVLNLEHATLFSIGSSGHLMVDHNSPTAAPGIQPGSNGKGLFVIEWHGKRTAFTTFDTFVTDLSARLADGIKVNKLFMTGSYDEDQSLFTAEDMKVQLQ